MTGKQLIQACHTVPWVGVEPTISRQNSLHWATRSNKSWKMHRKKRRIHSLPHMVIFQFMLRLHVQFLHAILHARIAARCKNWRQVKSVGKNWFTAKNPGQNLNITACKNWTCNHSFSIIPVKRAFLPVDRVTGDRIIMRRTPLQPDRSRKNRIGNDITWFWKIWSSGCRHEVARSWQDARNRRMSRSWFGNIWNTRYQFADRRLVTY